MISLVAFLGNYGPEYEKTRHNAAWQFADSLPFADRLVWQEKFKGKCAVVKMDQLVQWLSASGVHTLSGWTGDKIYFLKPLTYMNLSGESIGELAHFYKINPDEILVIHDELELPVGTVSLKWSGGLGGHNGLRSVKAVLGTADFWRIRFGISKPAGKDIAEYVLNEFSSDERIIFSQVFAQSIQLLSDVILSGDPARFIPEWGKKKLSAE